MRKTRRREHRGGAVFEGSEGCVFTPELKSKDPGFLKTRKYPTRSGKYVTKMYGRKEDLMTEVQGITLMRQVDPTGEYTKTYIDTTSKPDITSIDPSEKCGKQLSDQSPALYMEYAGMSIQALRKSGKLNEVIKPVLAGLSRLSDLFVKTAAIDVYHTDIQPGNLLYNKDDQKVYLIDFTGMRKMPGVTDKSVDIKSLATVIFDILKNYRKSQMDESQCANALDIILTKNIQQVSLTKDVDVIHTIITSMVDSVLKTCFKGGRRRKTLRRSH